MKPAGMLMTSGLMLLLAATSSVTAKSTCGLVPCPHSFTWVEGIDLPERTDLVVTEEHIPSIAVGVERLQRRLTDGTPLKVERMNDPAKSEAPLRIVIGTPQSEPVKALLAKWNLTCTPEDPGSQGYLVHSETEDGRTTVLLAGSDAVGALYATVTFGQMLIPSEQRVWMRIYRVRDVPDFTRRGAGKLPPPPRELFTAKSLEPVREACAEYVREAKAYVDWCLDFKINLITLRSGGTRQWSAVQTFGPPLRRALREISDYARDRGILLEATAYSAVDVGQGGAVAEMELLRTHGVGYSWSHDDLLKQQAEEFGKFARAGGIGLYYLQAPDVMKLDDPGGFKQRSASCRERWRDDQRAEADAHVMNIMIEGLRALNPDINICAVLAPCGATLDRLEEAEREEILAYWRKANDLLPKDVAVCMRENRRPNTESFKQAFKDHPIYFHIDSRYERGWEPAFTTTPRMINTFDFDDPRDLYYYGSGGDFDPFCRAMAAHFSWNSKAPGWALQRPHTHDPFMDYKEPSEVADDLVQTLCDIMFGEKAGREMRYSVRSGASWAFTADPEKMSRAAINRLQGVASDIPGHKAVAIDALADVTKLMQFQASCSCGGFHFLRKLDGMLQSGEVKFDERQAKIFRHLYSYQALVRSLALVRHCRMKAEDALRANNLEGAAEAAMRGLKMFDTSLERILNTRDRIEGMKNWHPKCRDVFDLLNAEKDLLQRLQKLNKGMLPEEAAAPTYPSIRPS